MTILEANDLQPGDLIVFRPGEDFGPEIYAIVDHRRFGSLRLRYEDGVEETRNIRGMTQFDRAPWDGRDRRSPLRAPWGDRERRSKTR